LIPPTGGPGQDTFWFIAALDPETNVDTITDFTLADDLILLENDLFIGLPNGVLAAPAFHIGAAAADADDRIIYDNATGAVIFDANGNAASGATQFATLPAGLALTNADFMLG
jgi:Ca2+-binding RTX toxin-like protein